MGGPAAKLPLGTRARHLFEYFCLRALLWLLSRLSWKGTAGLGRQLGSFTYHVLRIRRRVTLDNLSHAFPEWDKSRRRRVALECYRSFGITFLELARLPYLSPAQLAQRVRFADLGIYDRARAEGHGAILLTGHFANWEMAGASLPGLGYPTSALVGTQSNRRVDAFVTRARSSAGMRVIPRSGGLRAVLRALRANEFVAILSDQDAGRGGVFVPLLGRAASTPLGPVRFARHARCPIIFGYGIRQADGSYFVEMPPPLYVRQDLPAEEAELEATKHTVRLLEEMIRRYPEQWFWMHRRWKTRPPEERNRTGGRREEEVSVATRQLR